MKEGKPAYTYNWLGLEQFTIASKQKLAAGKHTLKFDFSYDGGRGAGGTGSIFMDGKKIGEGKIGKTHGNTFGIDENTPVNPAYKGKSKFTGKIDKITVETFPAKK